MSMDKCKDCDKLIDTDCYPESYREEYDDLCLCDDCFDSREIQRELNIDVCPTCNGSGEGMYDGTICSSCKGGGEVGKQISEGEE